MEPKSIFESFYKELQSKYFKDLPDSSESEEDTVKHIETNYYPHLLKIVQRDETLFENTITFRGVDISQLFSV
jgi:hypothetical protein